MSTRFGPVRQFGFVVEDMGRAIDTWTKTMGVGPFFVLHDIAFRDYVYRGRSAPSPVCTFGIAQWGEMQLELICQENDAPSAYREFLSAGRTGIHHMSTWFGERNAYEAARAEGIAQGMGLVHESRNEAGRFCYFETGRPDVPHLELAEALMPGSVELMDRIAQASLDWDGSDPVRVLRERRGGGTGAAERRF